MPRRSARLATLEAACAVPTARERAATIVAESPSKEALDHVAALYDAYFSDENRDETTLECLNELDAVQFLERALWPLADVVSTDGGCHLHAKKAWLVCVLNLVSFRARRSGETTGANGSTGMWSFLSDGDAAWKIFVTTLWTVVTEADATNESDSKWTLKEQTALTQFLITCFQSLDVPQVASSVLQMTSLPLWTALSPNQRALEFQTYPKLERHWNRYMSSTATAAEEDKTSTKNKRRKVKETTATLRPDQTALVHRLDAFFLLLKAPVDENVTKREIASRLRFVALFLALLIDLLSQLPTRRFLLPVLRRRHVRSALQNSVLIQHSLQWQSANDRQAINKQLALLDACMRFPVDAHTGMSLSSRECRERQDRHIQALQQRAFQSFRNSRVEDLAIAPCSHIANASSFTEMLTSIVAADRAQLSSLAIAVGVLADPTEASTVSETELIAFFVEEYSTSNSIKQDVLAPDMPVYPTELDIWNQMLDRKDLIVHNGNASGDGNSMETVDKARVFDGIYSADKTNLFPVLPMRKLGLQYLNIADYLQRNYELLQLEAAQDIREDLEVTIRQLDAVRALRSSRANDTVFRGFSRFGVPLVSALQIVKVGKPSLGQVAPASVIAELEVDLSSRHDRRCFDCYQTKEVVFLVAVRATADEGSEMLGFQKDADDKGSFPESFGVQYVRAAEVLRVTDAAGSVINDENPIGKGSKRTFKLALDGVQYKNDLEAGHLDAYEQVNLLVRRQPRDNNFKAVLDTLSRAWHDADKEELLPAWLHDLFLGYGDPSAALYRSIYKAKAKNQLAVPMDDLLLDGEHALEAGGASKLVHVDDDAQELSAKDAVAPFTYVEDVRNGSTFIRASRAKKRFVEHSGTHSPVRFTKAQVAAVRTGSCEGLTLVVGPPGTGKTDVAVQLVLQLYRSTSPREKVLIVAHSNQALNDFFSKILAQKVIHEAEIVRMGQRQHASGLPDEGGKGAFYADFSRNGRVAFLLERRIALLAEVEQMAQWLIKRDPVRYAGLAGRSASYSCANALVFYQFHMKTFLDAAREATELDSKHEKVVAFSAFFAARKGDPPSEIEALRQFAVDIESYFAELRRLQPFELLQTPRQRGDMYLIHHARIVAMTCTHAALNYSKIADLGLRFGSLIMEEAAQVSEVDSIVPLLLTCPKKAGPTSSESDKCSGLQRVVLMGDAKQLPPVVKSLALKNYAHFDQSLFTRLLRLGAPHIVLDRQGRSRSELADIFRWRYDDAFTHGEKHTTLGDLPRVKSEIQHQTGNAGFSHVARFVDLSGTANERQSKPFAYENEEEARFIVALFHYMLRIGYRADQVAILSTYNAQNELLQRLLRAQVPEAAKVCRVSTVDRFQGQQSDYVLLSTVRSGASVGHLRDVRRATTAFSRARLGLYVVGCLSTLEQAQELQPFVSKLVSVAKRHDGDKATMLALVPSAKVGAVTPSKDEVCETKSRAKHHVVHISDRKQLEKVVAELGA